MSDTSRKSLRKLVISAVIPLRAHAANYGDKAAGNINAMKRTSDGRCYIGSGMAAHALLEAIDENSQSMPHDKEDDIMAVSNGDGRIPDIKFDLGADFRGYFRPHKGSMSDVREAVLGVGPMIALSPSNFTMEVKNRVRRSEESEGMKEERLDENRKSGDARVDDENNAMMLFHAEFSELDYFVLPVFLDVSRLGRTPKVEYAQKCQISCQIIESYDDAERRKRINLALDGIMNMRGFASETRFPTSARPDRILIALEPTGAQGGLDYWDLDPRRQASLRAEWEDRGVTYFIGDESPTAPEGAVSVYETIKLVKAEIAKMDIVEIPSWRWEGKIEAPDEIAAPAKKTRPKKETAPKA